MKNNAGFSLIELLIVVVILGILASLAIPNLLASRRSANEGSAISDMRLYHGAQMTYASSYGAGNYAGDPGSVVSTTSFTQLGAAGIIDPLLAGGSKSGYLFTGAKVDASDSTPSSFCGRATPMAPTGLFATGPRNIAIATDGVMFAEAAAVATNAGCTNVSGTEIVTSAFPLQN